MTPDKLTTTARANQMIFSRMPSFPWLLPPLVLIKHQPHWSLRLLITVDMVIWHRPMACLTFIQKGRGTGGGDGGAFLFSPLLISVNVFAISSCQTFAGIKSMSFTQEWFGHAKVSHSRFIIPGTFPYTAVTWREKRQFESSAPSREMGGWGVGLHHL